MSTSLLSPTPFSGRHIGPDADDLRTMLAEVGAPSLDAFIDSVVPPQIRTARPLNLPAPMTEDEAISAMRGMASQNSLFRSLIGMGYSDTLTPAVIQRNILENPGWYTQYTPYQAEIAQGRLEALLNFQTMVMDLTGFGIANASLLDEATAAAEAMVMFFGIKGRPAGGKFFVSELCHPQTIAVVKTRAKWLGIDVVVGSHEKCNFTGGMFGALLQYPATDGAVIDYTSFCEKAHAAGTSVIVAADLLACVLLKPPGEFGADAAVGNTQRFGVPLGYGGPHAAYLATRDEFKRQMPGRIIGVSVDSRGKPALRMALQTREQHIRREKATSNICTAQVLLAIMAGMYAVYHGPAGLRNIAGRIHQATKLLASGLKKTPFKILHTDFFDTLHVTGDAALLRKAETVLRARKFNPRIFADGTIGIALDERTNRQEIDALLASFEEAAGEKPVVLAGDVSPEFDGKLKRATPFLTHPVFNTHHSETEMLRYIRFLEEKDLSLAVSMIPLGSCTMKLNATAELLPITWPEFAGIHPFVPTDQAAGFTGLVKSLESQLKEITGFSAFTFQPNSGANGEYTGLLVIREYHEHRGDAGRNVCLIPSSAHGTNPASAVMAGMEVVVVKSKSDGSIDIADLEARAREHRDKLAALMVTYPSTHGVFEDGIKDICRIIHENGGQVYMDGANMNAQVGLCRPAELGADVCHLNLHKTFCIPHGGGGPGMGPVGVAAHLVPFLPSHPCNPAGAASGVGPVAAAPWGSADILQISWVYIAMMGGEGLTLATKMAILNANYMARRLAPHYPIVYTGMNGRVAHEFILDLRQVKLNADVEVEDVAKRLMDYGFHAPTTSFPVVGTLMIEPTESEPKEEMDRYCEALILIRKEIDEIEKGNADRANNLLKNAPHTAEAAVSDGWNFPYSRERAVYPAPWTRHRKFWVPVGRVNNVQGDRNLICSCPPMSDYEQHS